MCGRGGSGKSAIRSPTWSELNQQPSAVAIVLGYNWNYEILLRESNCMCSSSGSQLCYLWSEYSLLGQNGCLLSSLWWLRRSSLTLLLYFRLSLYGNVRCSIIFHIFSLERILLSSFRMCLLFLNQVRLTELKYWQETKTAWSGRSLRILRRTRTAIFFRLSTLGSFEGKWLIIY